MRLTPYMRQLAAEAAREQSLPPIDLSSGPLNRAAALAQGMSEAEWEAREKEIPNWMKEAQT